MENEVILEKFSKRFANLIKENNTNFDYLLKTLGIKSKSTIYRYMNAQMSPKITTIKILADFFNVNPVWLMGYDVPIKKQNENNIDINTDKYIYACPVYGRISAGMPNWAEECIEGRLPIDPNLMGIVDPEECYFLRVNGESMNKVIANGAYALIRKTDWVENGEIAVVLVNGFDATLKKFTKNSDVVVLEPISDDPTIQTQIYTRDTPIKIIGKYIGKFEMKQ